MPAIEQRPETRDPYKTGEGCGYGGDHHELESKHPIQRGFGGRVGPWDSRYSEFLMEAKKADYHDGSSSVVSGVFKHHEGHTKWDYGLFLAP